jgi:hypothetical protein
MTTSQLWLHKWGHIPYTFSCKTYLWGSFQNYVQVQTNFLLIWWKLWSSSEAGSSEYKMSNLVFLKVSLKRNQNLVQFGTRPGSTYSTHNPMSKLCHKLVAPPIKSCYMTKMHIILLHFQNYLLTAHHRTKPCIQKDSNTNLVWVPGLGSTMRQIVQSGSKKRLMLHVRLPRTRPRTGLAWELD